MARGLRAVRDERAEVAEPVLARLAGREHEPHRVVEHRVVHEHLVGRRLQRGRAGRGGIDALGRRRVDAHAPDDLGFLAAGRVADEDLHQEAVALRLGQRVHALALDRVLRREHEERLGHRVGDAADRHVALGHHLEQRRLHLRRRAVDLVGEHDVGEDRAELDVERFLRRAVDARADEVGGHEVGRELQAGERAAEDARDRLGGERLGQAGRAFEQAVAAGEPADEEPLDHAVLADEDPLGLEQRGFEQLGRFVGGRARVGLRDVDH